MARPEKARGGPPRELVARSRVLALVVTAGSLALVAIILALPFTMEHALEGAQLLLWAALLLIVALIVGISLVYAYVTRSASSRQEAPFSGEGREAAPADREELTLQLLPADERALYRRILHEGGELLQKDLHGMLPFSGPKISRLLDRLEGKGLVVRERHGMTNRIRVLRERG